MVSWGGVQVNGASHYTDIIYKTTDGGETWYKVLDNFEGGWDLDDLDMRDSLYGITVDGNKYYETFDGGETWQFGMFEIPDGQPNHVYCVVEFAGDRCLIGSMGIGMFAWEEVLSSSYEELGTVKVFQSGEYLRVGSDMADLELYLYDLQGKLVTHESFNFNTNINLSSHNGGVLLYQLLHQGKPLESGKIALQR